MNPKDRLIVALDVEGYDAAAAMVDTMAPHLTWYKIGATLFSREGRAYAGWSKRRAGNCSSI